MFSARAVICCLELAHRLTGWWKRHRLQHHLRPEAHHAAIYWPTSAVCLGITGTSASATGRTGTKWNTCWGLHQPLLLDAKAYFIYLFSQVPQHHDDTVRCMQNADRRQEGLSTDCMSMCHRMHLQHSRRNSEEMHHLQHRWKCVEIKKNVLNGLKALRTEAGKQASACRLHANINGNVIERLLTGWLTNELNDEPEWWGLGLKPLLHHAAHIQTSCDQDDTSQEGHTTSDGVIAIQAVFSPQFFVSTNCKKWRRLGLGHDYFLCQLFFKGPIGYNYFLYFSKYNIQKTRNQIIAMLMGSHRG